MAAAPAHGDGIPGFLYFYSWSAAFYKKASNILCPLYGSTDSKILQDRSHCSKCFPAVDHPAIFRLLCTCLRSAAASRTACCRFSCSIIKRSEEHMSELQSRGHLV